jgi:inner membrane protein
LHYGLVGAALCIFYILLLSLAEVVGFPAAYAASAAAVVAQTSVFTWAVVRNLCAATVFAAVLAGVYAYLYVLLDLEDLALLGGALGLFVLLSAAMYALRGVGATRGPSAVRQEPSPVSS